jgi:6-phosphogluconolactonase
MGSTKGCYRIALTVLATLVLMPAALYAQFVYVANESSGTISGYKIEPTTGELTPIVGSPFPTDTPPSPAAASPLSLTVDPRGRFAYSANFAGSVSGYTIDSTTGALTLIPGSPLILVGASFVTVDPRGRFAYVALLPGIAPGGTIWGYTIDRITGALTPISGSPFPGEPGGAPAAIAVDPSGRFAYAANDTGSVSGYAINSDTGALTAVPGSPFPAGLLPSCIAVDARGKFLYVGNSEDNNLSGYTIDSETGALTAIPGSPFLNAEGSPLSIAVDPSGTFVYVASAGGSFGRLSGYSINSQTGALTELEIFSNQAFLIPGPTFVALDPTGKFAYVANSAGYPKPGNVWGYSINRTTGIPTALPESPFPAEINPISIAITRCARRPRITDISASPARLWPPNHELVDVFVDYDVSAPCGEPPVCTLSVASNEPVKDDERYPDWVVLDDHHVELRAERSRYGTERIYTIKIHCKDASGNSATGDTAVTVSRDESH